MTQREWKPGEVAMVRTREYGESVGIRTSSECVEFFHAAGFSIVADAQVRPLVTIDPENEAQVERLAAEIAKETTREGLPHELTVKKRAIALRRVLREFANPTPPKPEEPTGLGAVVVIRWDDGSEGTATRFRVTDAGADWALDSGPHQPWSALPVEQVLSEGHQ